MKNRTPGKNKGLSYRKRLHDVNEIYDHWAKLGYPNRTIWRNWIWPVFCISERTFYNLLKRSETPELDLPSAQLYIKFDFDNPEKEESHGERT